MARMDEPHADRRELSGAQLRVWALAQLDPASAACNLFCALCLRGRLNVHALHRAFDSVSARHETLRTAIEHQPGMGPRLVRSTHLSRVVHTDLRALPRAQGKQCAQALAEHHVLQPFDLGSGPLWRVSLLKLAGDERVLLVCMHRLIADEASMRLFIDEVIRSYRIHDGGDEPGFADLPLHRDYPPARRVFVLARRSRNVIASRRAWGGAG